MLAAPAGGQDAFGYYWRSSDSSGGPIYNWKDITQVGQQLSLNDPNDGVSANQQLGFNFNFYDHQYSYVKVSVNGLAYFMNAYFYTPDNVAIPDQALPNNLMAVFYDDLTLQYGGNIYFYSNQSDSAIITWQNVKDTRQAGTFTFQIIMIAPDTIIYQYANMGPGRLNECSVGIENLLGTIGLQVAYNSNYIHSNFATAFYMGGRNSFSWLGIDPHEGPIPAGGNQAVSLSFNSEGLSDGTYDVILKLRTNDENNLSLDIPVSMVVTQGGCQYGAGDINGDGITNGLDVSYLVRYFLGGNNSLQTCSCASYGAMEVSADVNGSCSVDGLDIIYLVNYLRRGGALHYCIDCPPPLR